MKKILFLILICSGANAQNINAYECTEEMQQGEVYWCLMDKYQQSVLALKHEEVSAQKRLEKYDKEEGESRGRKEDDSLDYEPYIHLAATTFPELHQEFILYREKQCKYSNLSNGALPGYRTAISSLYCKINMNLSQIKWLKDFI